MALEIAFHSVDGTLATPWRDVEEDVVTFFFGQWSSRSWELGGLASYFEYYRAEIRGLSEEVGAYSQQRFELPVDHHIDFINIVKELQQNSSVTKNELRSKLNTILPRPGAVVQIDRCIDIAVRLWLMVNTREQMFANDGKGQRRECLAWPEKQRFRDFLHGLFEKSSEKLSLKERRLKPGFTAAYMANVCQLRIEWTYSLEDHLRLDRHEDTRILWVFAEEQFLKAHDMISCFDSVHGTATPLSPPPGPTLASASQPSLHSFTTATSIQHMAKSPYPKDLLAETLLLLFPSWDRETIRLLKRMKMRQFSPQAGSRVLSLRKYPYWQQRLLELYEEVYLAPPVGIKQLWMDRRDPEKFFNFFIAAMVFILTLVSTVTGIIQTVTAIMGVGGNKSNNSTTS